MGKMKQLLLEHRGYEIQGVAVISLWGGDTGVVNMQSVFIPADKLSHTVIKRSVNDGGFGCQRIEAAEVHIYDVYGSLPGYKQYNRTIELDYLQCMEAFRR